MKPDRTVPSGAPALTYCLNVHPGETWADHLAAIERYAAAVKAEVSPDATFPLGLRLSARAARFLDRPERIAAARDRLRALGMAAVTINGFSCGRFHGPGVKEKVYAPDWRSDGRLAYTLRLARILAGLLPRGGDGSISTVPGSFAARIRSDASIRAMIRRWAVLCAGLDALRRDTGRDIHIGLEPEPDCMLETGADLADFLTRRALPGVVAELRARAGWSARRSEAAIRRHLGACLDTCHSSVGGESPAAAIRRLAAEGVRLSKIQLSAAVGARNTPDGRAGLRTFADNVYLHQTRSFRGGRATGRWTDLTPALDDLARQDRAMDIRVHCHIPLFHRPAAPMRSTVRDLDGEFWTCAVRATSILEIETYTFHALPERIRSIGAVESIIREFRWVRARLPA